jgi:hypothetical protein
LKYNNKNKIFMNSAEHNNVFIALVATSFSRQTIIRPMLRGPVYVLYSIGLITIVETETGSH